MSFKSFEKNLKIRISFVIFCCFVLVGGGRPKAKPGILAASQVNGAGKSKSSDYDLSQARESEEAEEKTSKNFTVMKRLKYQLLHEYDNTLIPLRRDSRNLRVKIGFTFRQVLDLDEKNQILKSLVWFRMQWEDEQLSWNPDQFNGLKEIELPHNDIWRPDIVVYEEIGIRDYSPRLQKFKVYSTGVIENREPTVFETSCSIDTAFFPFDAQVCFITFVSWTEPVTKIDLSADRKPLKLLEDAKKYFINTGEWQLVGINVDKVVKDYGELLDTNVQNLTHNNEVEDHVNLFEAMRNKSLNETTTESNSGYQSTTEWIASINRDRKENHKHVFPMRPLDFASFETLGNLNMKPTMFSEVKYTIVVRRNSSLYMQSMLFPSILLTTVALLGFYLPPDSGERIGLQITILLTFMVFLLAVGEMFPASTGPYLGVYFVICMALLGVNLGMTVLVLHIHFKPVIIQDPDMQRKMKQRRRSKTKRNILGSCSCCKKVEKQPQNIGRNSIPKNLRRFLIFCDRYWSLKEDNASWLYSSDTNDDCDVNEKKQNSLDDDSSSSGAAEDDVQYSPQMQDTESNTQETISRDRVPSHSTRIRTLLNRPKDSVNATPELRIDEPKASLPTNYEIKQLKTRPSDYIDNDHMSCEAIDSPGAEGVAFNANNNLWSKEEQPLPLRSITSLLGSFPPSSNGGFKVQNSDVDSSLSTHLPETESLPNNREETTPFRHRVLGVLNELKGYVKKSESQKHRRKTRKQKRAEQKKRRKEKEQEREEKEQEEWKSVARAIDLICFRFYVFLIIVSHFGLFGAALKTYLSKNHEGLLIHKM